MMTGRVRRPCVLSVRIGKFEKETSKRMCVEEAERNKTSGKKETIDY